MRRPGLITSRRNRATFRSGSRPRVLIIVQNLPVPFDRRVWLECQALRDAGHDVTVICPKGQHDPTQAIIDGIELFKYSPYAPGGSPSSYVLEYAYSFIVTVRLALRARHQSGPFTVVQACNPPDIFWPLARMLRRLDGTRFVFDHHDLCPELFVSRFPRGNRAVLRGLLLLERATVHSADRVVSTNDSYAEIVTSRHRKERQDVVVVRTGPDPDGFRPGPSDPALRKGRRHLVAYIGVMGPQDGVDIILRAAHVVVHEMGRRDVQFLLMGAGDCRDELIELQTGLDLTEHVDLPGRVPDDFVRSAMSTAVVGLSPDPKNPLNDVSTMNKTMEYMAFGLPIVAFNLRETRVSAQDAAVYVEPNNVAEYAKALVALLDDPERRSRLGAFGRDRAERVLAWRHQARAYLALYEDLTCSTAGLPARDPVLAGV